MSNTCARIPLVASIVLVACTSSMSSGSGAGSSGGTSSGGTTPVTCATVESEIAEAHLGTFAAGSWGNIPASLQALPPGAVLCGTNVLADGGTLTDAQTVITMSLTGTALSSYYTPLFQQLGCSQESGVVAGELAFHGCTGGMLGTVTPAASGEAYVFLAFGSD